MAEYRVNVEQIRSQANKISALSSDLSKEISRLERIRDSFGSDWQGPASQTFVNKLNSLISNVRSTKSVMGTLASDICEIANETEKTDDILAEQSKKLS